MNEARLQEAYQRSLAQRDDGTRADCVPIEAIHARARGESPESERLEALTHVMSCRACQRELDLLRAIERAGTSSGAAPVMTRQSTRALPWRVMVPVALAASLVVAAFIGVQDYIGRDRALDIPRGGETGLALVTPNDSAELITSAPLTFTWRTQPDARGYLLELLTPSGEVVLSRTTSDTTITLTDEVSLASGTEYQWWVRANSPAGQRASPMRRLRMRSP